MTKPKQQTVLIGNLPLPITVKPGMDAFGEFVNDAPDSHIAVKRCDLRCAEDARTLFHECLHAISAFHGLNLKEAQIRTLEHAVPDLLIDNPKLTKGLLTSPRKT
jgi:hypothetical protein